MEKHILDRLIEYEVLTIKDAKYIIKEIAKDESKKNDIYVIIYKFVLENFADRTVSFLDIFNLFNDKIGLEITKNKLGIILNTYWQQQNKKVNGKAQRLYIIE